MSNVSDNAGNPVQALLFIVLFFIGLFVGSSYFSVQWHEDGHLYAAKLQDIPAHQSKWNEVTVNRLTPRILAGGFGAEITLGLLATMLCFCVSNPRKWGWRQHYCYIGLPLGFCHGEISFFLSSTDALQLAQLYDVDPLMVVFDKAWCLIPIWIIVLFLRLLPLKPR